MEDLNKKLKEKIKNFNVTNNNLEAELEKDKYNEDLLEIKKIIWEAVYESDNEVLKSIVSNDVDKFNNAGFQLLIDSFASFQNMINGNNSFLYFYIGNRNFNITLIWTL
jgi:formyltetrahydrofolate synthetase